MTQIRRIYTNYICAYPFHPRLSVRSALSAFDFLEMLVNNRTLMTKIRLAFTDCIRAYPFDPRYPRSNSLKYVAKVANWSNHQKLLPGL